MSGKGYSVVFETDSEVLRVRIVSASSNETAERMMMIVGKIVGVHSEGNAVVVSTLPKGATAPVVAKLEIDFRVMSEKNLQRIVHHLMYNTRTAIQTRLVF